MATFGAVTSSTSLQRHISFGAAQLKKGATAPTDATVNTTPTVYALLFAATNELVSTYVAFPDDMDRTVNCTIHLEWALVSAQTNGDTCDWTIDYIAPRENSTGNGLAKTSTQITGTTTVTTGNGLAVGDVYTTSLTVSAGDATNPTANANGLYAELHLTDTTGVASAHLFSVHLLYTAKY